jgi:hypothetical protein
MRRGRRRLDSCGHPSAGSGNCLRASCPKRDRRLGDQIVHFARQTAALHGPARVLRSTPTRLPSPVRPRNFSGTAASSMHGWRRRRLRLNASRAGRERAPTNYPPAHQPPEKIFRRATAAAPRSFSAFIAPDGLDAAPRNVKSLESAASTLTIAPSGDIAAGDIEATSDGYFAGRPLLETLRAQRPRRIAGVRATSLSFAHAFASRGCCAPQKHRTWSWTIRTGCPSCATRSGGASALIGSNFGSATARGWSSPATRCASCARHGPSYSGFVASYTMCWRSAASPSGRRRRRLPTLNSTPSAPPCEQVRPVPRGCGRSRFSSPPDRCCPISLFLRISCSRCASHF